VFYMLMIDMKNILLRDFLGKLLKYFGEMIVIDNNLYFIKSI